jgi:toxin ParE1/3/4
MSVILMTAQAEQDLIEIWLYIAQDSPNIADSVLDGLEKRFSILADNPLMGRSRDDIAPELRYFLFEKYLIFYRTASDGIEIVRVVHGARNLIDILI